MLAGRMCSLRRTGRNTREKKTMKSLNVEYFEQWKHTSDIWLTICIGHKVRWIKNRDVECIIDSIEYQQFAGGKSTLMYNVLLNDGKSYRAAPMKVPERELEVLA